MPGFRKKKKRSGWVELHGDGSCIHRMGATGRAGVGGWGVILRSGVHEKELSGAEAETTNNRMEMMAVLMGLRALKRPCRVAVYSDSQLVVRCGSGEYRRKANRDLWDEIAAEEKRHIEILWNWVRGHAGDHYNERADALATTAAAEFVKRQRP